MKTKFALALALLTCLCIFAGCHSSEPGAAPTAEELAHNTALDLIEKGDYEAAYAKLQECPGYKDTAQLLGCFVYKCDEEITHYTYDPGGDASRGTYRYVNTYNQYGDCVLSLYYGNDGQQQNLLEYQYNDMGKMTHEYMYSPDKSILYVSQICQYNDHGSMVHWTYYSNRGNNPITAHTSVYTYEYEYNERGDVIEKRQYHEDGRLIETFKWSRDEHGNIVLFIRSDKDGKVEQRDTHEYVYDENGNVTHEDRYIINGDLHSSIDYTYDAKGNMLSEIGYYGSGNLMTHEVYTYNEYGLVTSETRYDSDGNIQSLYEYEYVGINLYFNPNLK